MYAFECCKREGNMLTPFITSSAPYRSRKASYRSSQLPLLREMSREILQEGVDEGRRTYYPMNLAMSVPYTGSGKRKV